MKRLVAETKEHANFMCPMEKKPIIDTIVYSTKRCVRTCFSMKKNDKTCTALRVLNSDSCMNEDALEEFCSLLVEPSESEIAVALCVDPRQDVIMLQVPSLGISVPNVMQKNNKLLKKQLVKNNNLSVSNLLVKRKHELISGNVRCEYNYTSEIINYLSQLSSTMGEKFEDWSRVLFCVRNMSKVMHLCCRVLCLVYKA